MRLMIKDALATVFIATILASCQDGTMTTETNAPDTTHQCKLGLLDDKLAKECKNGYAYRCNNRGLSQVPKFPRFNDPERICLLDLSYNELTRIYNRSFTDIADIAWLYLFENQISQIDPDAFANLTNLVYINFTSNKLHITDSFGEGVFEPLVNLRYINLKNNNINSYDGLEKLLQPLKNLHSLYISGCYNCVFEAGFENFLNLTTISLSGTGPNMCNINVLLRSTFVHVPQITNLYLSSCNIRLVESLVLIPLRNIQKLDISYNEDLGFTGMMSLLIDLKFSPIKSLNFDRIYEFFGRGTILPKQYIAPIQYLKQLTYIRLDLNKIEVIDKEVFNLLPKTTTHVVLSGNRLTYGEYVRYLVNLKHVTYLDISRQHLNYDPFLRQHYENPLCHTSSNSDQGDPLVGCLHDAKNTSMQSGLSDSVYSCMTCMTSCRIKKLTCVCIPPKVKTIIWKMSFLRFRVQSFKVCPPTSLRTLDVSFNLIFEWTGPVFGLEKLMELNLSENYCKNMSSQFFDNFHSLRKLNVSYNFLGPILAPRNKDDGKHFKHLTDLENLDLSENRICSLSVDLFQNLTRLKYLNISGNMIQHWNSTLRTKCLQLIDLSGNRLGALPEPFIDYLDGLTGLRPKKTCKRKEPVTVDLSNNPIQCHCESKPFLMWLSSTNVYVKFSETDKCVFGGRALYFYNVSHVGEFVQYLERNCFPYISVVVSSCICLLTAVLCFFAYHHRWKLRHLYYSNRKRHHHKGYERLFERDAFISYAKSEACFIKNKLVPALEEEPLGLKVWVADRDSLAGASVAENITHAVHNCKKSVLILSKNYFRENWCNYEMNMSRMESIESNRKMLIIVVYNDVKVKEIPLDYLRLLNSEQSLEYPSHPQNLNTFWASLAEAIQAE